MCGRPYAVLIRKCVQRCLLACNRATVEDVEEDKNDETCAICFENRPFEALPCACRVKYCHSCWDRALAVSISVRGRAACPSCRQPLKVDFDPNAGRLIFSKDVDGKGATDWRPRLYGKARPVQIRLLRKYGVAMLQSRASEGPTNTSIVATPTSQKTKIAKLMAEMQSSADVKQKPDAATKSGEDGKYKCVLPECVCGAFFEHVSQRARIIRMLDDTDSGWRSRVSGPIDAWFDRLLASALVSCDLCDEDITRSSAVWTCTNGPHTVLHPAAYDVCEKCFEKYAGPRASSLLRENIVDLPLRTSSPVHSETPETTIERAGGATSSSAAAGGCVATGCCRACVSVFRGLFRKQQRHNVRLPPIAPAHQHAAEGVPPPPPPHSIGRVQRDA